MSAGRSSAADTVSKLEERLGYSRQVNRKTHEGGLVIMVDIAKMRWRIERDYQDLKQEIGLGHYEGRGWRGFHHHGTIPPSGPRSAGCSRNLPFPVVTDPAAPPLRPQRHIPNSIATVHCAMVVAIARMLPRCPCCARRSPRNMRQNL